MRAVLWVVFSVVLILLWTAFRSLGRGHVDLLYEILASNASLQADTASRTYETSKHDDVGKTLQTEDGEKTMLTYESSKHAEVGGTLQTKGGEMATLTRETSEHLESSAALPAQSRPAFTAHACLFGVCGYERDAGVWVSRFCNDSAIHVHRGKQKFLGDLLLLRRPFMCCGMKETQENYKNDMISLTATVSALGDYFVRERGCYILKSGRLDFARGPVLPKPPKYCAEDVRNCGNFHGAWTGLQWRASSGREEADEVFSFQELFGVASGSLFGLHLRVIGDSMAKNVFNRLICWVRMKEMPIDHKFDCSATYILYANGSDVLDVCPGLGKVPKAGVALRIDYVSVRAAGVLQKTLEAHRERDSFNLTAIVFGRWEQPLDKWRKAFDRSFVSPSSSEKTIVATMPIKSWDFNPKYMPDKKTQVNFNKLFSRQEKQNAVLRKGANKKYYILLDFDRLIHTEGFSVGVEIDSGATCHYQCGIKWPPYPQRPYSIIGRRFVNIAGRVTRAFECTDPVNLVVSHTILHIAILTK